MEHEDDDTITIESATATPEEMAASLAADAGTPAGEVSPPEPEDATPAEPPAPAVAPVAEPPTPAVAAASEFEQKIDELDPPLPNETKEQRAARMSRGEKRILGLLSRAKTSETQLDQARTELARLKTAPPAATQPGAATEPAKVTVPAFSFDTWDAYSEKHPESSYEDWLDARGDARETWKADKHRIETEVETRERLTREIATELQTRDARRRQHVDDFRVEHPEYDAVVATARDLPLPPAMADAIDEQGPLGPAIVLHLAQHRDEHLKIVRLSWTKQGAAIERLAETLSGTPPVATTPSAQATAPAATPATPSAAASPSPGTGRPAIPRAATPSRPLSDAPAPTTEVVGGAQPTRSLQQLAADGDDADQYIIERQRQRRELGLTG